MKSFSRYGKRIRHKKRKIIAAVAFAIVAIILILLSFLLDRFDQNNFSDNYYEDPYDDYTEENESIRYNGKWYNLNHDIKTYLLIGVDKFEDDLSDPDYFTNNQCSDFLMLLAVDQKKKTVNEILINRDTIADVNMIGIDGDNIGTKKMQITLSHTYGSGLDDSCENTMKAVSTLFYGIPLDKFYSVTMDAVPVITDAIGGVEVLIKDDLTEVDPYLEHGKKVLITAEHVLPYVRARMNVGEGTNLERMERQVTFLKGAKDKILDKLKYDDNFMIDIFLDIEGYSVTNLRASELNKFADEFSDYTFNDIITLKGEALMGERYMEFYPDEEKLQELVVDIWYSEDRIQY